jgi:hypothetical protein
MGDTLQGYTNRSAERLLQAITGSFSGNKAMQALFKLDKDGKSFSSINIIDFLHAASGADNIDQVMLGIAYMTVINDVGKQIVSISKTGEATEDGI